MAKKIISRTISPSETIINHKAKRKALAPWQESPALSNALFLDIRTANCRRIHAGQANLWSRAEEEA